MRKFVFSMLFLTAGCASMQARSAAVDTATKASQIVVTVDRPAEQVTPLVLNAFMQNGLSVSATSPNFVESKLSAEPCLGGKCSIAVRALVVQSGTGARVTLYADESRDIGSSVSTERASALSHGRAGDTWRKLKTIGAQLQPDSTKRQVSGNP
jgi:hypothetical protein